MPTKMRPAPAAAPVPQHPADALVAGRVAERRQELAEHNPAAVEVAGAALRAGADAAWGRVPQIRADRQVRYREMQLHGEKATPVEDLAAIGMEPGGDAVLLAILRVLAARALPVPHLVIPAPAGERMEPVAFDVLTRGSETARALADALRDGQIDRGEAIRMCPAARDLYESLGALLALLESRRAA